MRHTKAEIYLHFVWGTWEGLPLVASDLECSLYRCIQSEAQRLNCSVLALGGTPDHVHLVVRVPTSVSAAKLAQQVKGVSSTFVRDELRPGELFRWQEGFGVFSISRSHVSRVVAYVQRQKDHHATGRLWPEWEDSSIEATRKGVTD